MHCSTSKIEDEYLLMLFGNDDRYPGYKNIVKDLVHNGSCFSIETALNMNFGQMSDYVNFTVPDEDGVIKLFICKHAILNSPLYKNFVKSIESNQLKKFSISKQKFDSITERLKELNDA